MSLFSGHIPIDQKTLTAVAIVTTFPYALPKRKYELKDLKKATSSRCNQCIV